MVIRIAMTRMIRRRHGRYLVPINSVEVMKLFNLKVILD